MLKAEGKINDAVIENMLSWRHSGFNVYCGPTIWPNKDKGLEDLARYIIRACFPQERMTSLPAKETLDPMNHNDGYDFSVIQVNCCQKTGKTAIICLVCHVGSKFADALIARL
jgi:hypothetical protein